MPVFEIGDRFEELGGKGETDGGDVGYAEEAAEDTEEGLEL